MKHSSSQIFPANSGNTQASEEPLRKPRHTIQLQQEELEQVVSFKKLAIILITISLGSLNLGYSFGYMTVSFSSVFDSIILKGSETEEQGLFSAVLPIGCLVGSAFIPLLTKKFTCNQTLIIADICGILSILSVIPVREMILSFRFLFGVSNGISCIIMPIYVKELCPDRHYNSFSVIAGFLIGIGLLLSYIFGMFYLIAEIESWWWQLMFAFPALICLIRILIVTVIYRMESPISLLEKEKTDETYNLLSKIYHQNSVEQALEKAKLRLEYNKQHHEGFLILFTKKHLKTILIGCMLMFMYTWCGIFAVFSYSSQFFGLLVGDDKTLNSVFSLILGISQQLPVYISGWLYGRYGKRTSTKRIDAHCLFSKHHNWFNLF